MTRNMTREEAITYLEDAKSDLPYKFEQAIEMAIEALSADAGCEDTQTEEQARFVAKETELAHNDSTARRRVECGKDHG